MSNSFIGIIFLIIMNSLPGKVDKFEFSGGNKSNEKISFTKDVENERWNVDDGTGHEGNWLVMTKDAMIIGDHGNIDTLKFSDIYPSYKDVNWKKFKSLEIQGGTIGLEKKKKQLDIFFEDESSEKRENMVVEWE